MFSHKGGLQKADKFLLVRLVTRKKTPLDALEFAIVLTSTDKCNYVKTFGKVQVLLKFMLIKLQD